MEKYSRKIAAMGAAILLTITCCVLTSSSTPIATAEPTISQPVCSGVVDTERESAIKAMVPEINKHKDFTIDDSLDTLYDAKRNAARSDYLEYVAGIYYDTHIKFPLIPYMLILAVARFETGHRVWNRGDGGWSQGLVQIHAPAHLARFQPGTTLTIRGKTIVSGRLSKDTAPFKFIWGVPEDMAGYGGWLMNRAVCDGKVTKACIRPWSVRNAAWSYYLTLSK